MPVATNAKKSRRVTIEFRNKDDQSFLSNYFLEPDGSSVQFEFQREKCSRDKDKKRFEATEARDPFQAKAIGHSIKIRKDWEDIKVATMSRLVHQKFMDHPDLAIQLLATGDAELVKRSDCSESFWGKNAQNKGENQLGKILMSVRSELKEG